MKTLSLCAVILFSIFSFNTSAQTIKKETIKVWGNCSMCKKTIETAAKSAGASYANWNENSKELKVSYAANKTSGTKIQEAIAKSGYDTQDFTADNNAYQKLHACCQYDRKDSAGLTTEKKCCDNANCKHDCKTGACKGMACCDKSMAMGDHKKCGDSATCKHDGKEGSCKGMACCKKSMSMGDHKKCADSATCKHDGKEGSCKGMACCKKSSAMGDHKKCCDNATCKHDSKEGSCKGMACCKEKSCCGKTASAD